MARHASLAMLVFLVLALLPCFIDALPDLVVAAGNINPRPANRNFPATDCAVFDGCIEPGNRRLLRFTTQIVNQGTTDLILGRPATNTAFFTWSACHRHYHRKDAVTAQLFDMQGNEVSKAQKYGWCMEDNWPINNLSPSRNYNCQNQGLSAGWSDIYGAGLDCQWVDITDVPAGTYRLRLTVNDNRAIQESNYDNNATEVTVRINNA